MCRQLILVSIILGLFLSTESVLAQKVISPSGANFKNDEISVSITVGELAIHTYHTLGQFLTQGYQQSLITVTFKIIKQ